MKFMIYNGSRMKNTKERSYDRRSNNRRKKQEILG